MNSIVLPGTIKLIKQVCEPSVRKFYVEETEPHTDSALMKWAECDSWLGGRVDRIGNQTVIVRYTS